MKKMKKILVPLTALVVATTLTACQTTSNNSSSSSTQEAKTVKITTTKGEVEVTKNPKNVASFDLAVLDLIQRYDVKVENLATPKVNAPFVANVTKGKDTIGSLQEPNYEAISTFKPDIIFTAGRQEKNLEEIQKVGKVAHFVSKADNLFESLIKDNTEIAKVFGVEDKVAADKAKFETKIKEISELAKKSGKKALIVMTNEGKITAFGPKSRFGFVHTLFGLSAADENIEVSNHGAEINYEYISKVNPDIIFFVDRNTVVQSKTNSNAKTTLDNELVKATNAGKAGAIYELEAQYAYLAPNALTSFEKMMEVVEKAVK